MLQVVLRNCCRERRLEVHKRTSRDGGCGCSHPVPGLTGDLLMPRSAEAEKRRQKFLKDPSDPRHGTPNGYSNLGCRGKACGGACQAAWADRHLEYMHSHPEQRVKQADRNMIYRGVERRTPYEERPHTWREVDYSEYEEVG